MSNSSPHDLFSYAKYLLEEKKNYHEAMYKFRECIEVYPNSDEAELSKEYLKSIENIKTISDDALSEHETQKRLNRVVLLWVFGGFTLTLMSAFTRIEIAAILLPLLMLFVVYKIYQVRCHYCGRHPGYWTVNMKNRCYHCYEIQKYEKAA